MATLTSFKLRILLVGCFNMWSATTGLKCTALHFFWLIQHLGLCHIWWRAQTLDPFCWSVTITCQLYMLLVSDADSQSGLLFVLPAAPKWSLRWSSNRRLWMKRTLYVTIYVLTRWSRSHLHPKMVESVLIKLRGRIQSVAQCEHCRQWKDHIFQRPRGGLVWSLPNGATVELWAIKRYCTNRWRLLWGTWSPAEDEAAVSATGGNQYYNIFDDIFQPIIEYKSMSRNLNRQMWRR